MSDGSDGPWDDDEDGWDDEYEDDDGEYEFVDEYEVVRPEASTARKIILVLLGVALVLAAIVGAGALWVVHQIDPPGPPGDDVAVEIPTGSSTSAIAAMLEDEGVISNSSVFRYYVRVKSAGPFQAGEFTFKKRSAMGDVIQVLEAGPAPPPFQEFTVPEGLTLPEIAAKIAEQVPSFTVENVNAAIASGQIRSRYQPQPVTNLEGLLFPDTYRIEEGEQEAVVVAKMVSQLDAVAQELGIDQAPQTVGLTPYQVLVVASLVEEEARIPEDQPKIARVIYNRLAQGEMLGIDATVCYALAEHPCSLSESDLETDSPYNTRKFAGLPPGPIAAPGRGAIDAALHPAEGDWIYYVLDASLQATKPGAHFFTSSSREFNAKKRECQEAGFC